ncbi:MAG: phosphoribosylanthranilate isomerase [Gemmatimonadetes bacterium]|nr:phosphoribosylanthranilate isomerase [Gemmatimonadota bacterium]
MKVKICCIASVAEAELALAQGAAALGLVSAMPSGPGVIGDDRIREIAAWAPAGVRTFLLTSRTDPRGIAAQVRDAGVNTVQIVDRLAPGAHAVLRALVPRVRLVQVIHVRGPESLDEALEAAPRVDELLLDSGNPAAAVRELGGTGRTHDWALSREIVDRCGVPVWLAGGLNETNVRAAIEEVRPQGVDLCSGVRVDGRLSEKRLAGFMRAVVT